eukprot:438739_1
MTINVMIHTVMNVVLITMMLISIPSPLLYPNQIPIIGHTPNLFQNIHWTVIQTTRTFSFCICSTKVLILFDVFSNIARGNPLESIFSCVKWNATGGLCIFKCCKHISGILYAIAADIVHDNI